MQPWLLANVRVRLAAALGLAALCVAGCGGSQSPGGTSLTAQIEAAQRNPDPQARARNLIILGYKQYQAQDSLGARETYRLAHKAAQEIQDAGVRAIELAKLAEGYARMKSPVDAKAVVREALPVIGQASEPFLKVTAYTALAKVMGLADDTAEGAALLRDAEGVVDQMPQNDDPIQLQQRVDSLISIAEGYYSLERKENGQALFTRIEQMIEAMPTPRSRADALAALGAAQSRLRIPEAEATFTAAVEAARQIDDLNNRAHALAEIAMKMPGRDQANALLDEAEKVASQVGDPGLRNEVQAKIRKARR